MERADVLRGFTVHVETGVEARTVDVGKLCPEARIFAFQICAAQISGEVVAGQPLCSLHLQDSQHDIYPTLPNVDPPAGGYSPDIGGSQPGVKWPASAKLEVFPNVVVTLQVSYGGCGGGRA